MNGIDWSQYVDKVFGWSFNRTGNRMEAEELTQRIMLAALESISSLRNRDAFHGWLWALARNVYKRWLHQSNQDRFYNVSLTDIDLFPQDQSESQDEAEKEALIQSITRLSQQWRDILVMHYFDGLSVKVIATTLDLPEGTVKWRLSEARRKVREELNEVEAGVYSTIKPVRLTVSMGGEVKDPDLGPWPQKHVKRRIAQNLCIAAYGEPKTIEDLSRLTGIPAFYIEDEVALLVEYELMRRSRNTVQTDFLIMRREAYTSLHDALNHHAQRIVEPFIQAVLDIEPEAKRIGYYNPGKTFHEQLWTLVPFAFLGTQWQRDISPEPIAMPPIRKDGGQWFVHGWESDGLQESTLSANGSWASSRRAFVTVYATTNVCPGVDWMGAPRSDEVELMYQALHGDLRASLLSDVEKESVAQLIQKGFLRREGESLILQVICANQSQAEALADLFAKILGSFKEELTAMREDVFTIYRTATPSHLEEQMKFHANFSVAAMAAYVMRAACSRQLLHPPADAKTAGVALLVV